MEFLPKSILHVWNLALDTIFPPVCLNCHAPIKNQSRHLCEKCFDKIRLNSALYCPVCMGRIASTRFKCHPSPFLLAPASFFMEPIPALIHNFKYQGIENTGTILSAMLIAYLKRINIELGEYELSYVPLHPAKERVRGFNQAKLLSLNVSDYFNRPCVDALKRTKRSTPQAKEHDYSKRFKNIRECFTVADPEAVKGKSFIVVDDVSTSGATLYEASRVLKKSGAKKILGLVIAKA